MGWSYVVFSSLSVLLCGCPPNTDSGDGNPASVRGVQRPVIEGVPFDPWRLELGDHFQPQPSGDHDDPNMVRLLATEKPFDELLVVERSPDGGVFSIAGYLAGPDDQGEQMDAVFARAVEQLLQSVGISINADLQEEIAIGALRTGIGCGHVFQHKMVLVYMSPNEAVEKDPETVAYRPNWVSREIRLSPTRGSKPPPAMAIPGVTLEQMTELLDGFSVAHRVGDGQIL